MIDDLLGYLLDALEPDDLNEVLRALESEPQLNRQLELLRRSFKPLGLRQEAIEAPPNLAERTWVVIRQSTIVVDHPAEPV